MRFMLVAAAFAAFATAPAQITVISNYPPANDATQSAGLSNLRVKAMAFTMGASTLPLLDVTLRLRNVDPGEVTVTLNAGGANPGGVLVNFLNPAFQGAPVMDYTFAPTSTFNLQAGQQYWLVVGGVSGGSFDWMASSPGITPTGIATHSGNLFSTNAGSTWTTSAIFNTYEVRAVPEPASMLVLGAGALALLRRRRKA
jgi:hypothetical protein